MRKFLYYCALVLSCAFKNLNIQSFVTSEGNIQLTAVFWSGVADGNDGKLATITFEVVEAKPSEIQLSDVTITNSASEQLEPTTDGAKVVVP